jgi:hypothetical protein
LRRAIASRRIRAALRQALAGHEPYPAVLVNRWLELIDGNSSVAMLTAGAAPALLEPPVNVLRLSLHPDGMAPRIANLAQWRAHVLVRLRRQMAATGDARLAELHEELRGYPGGEIEAPHRTDVVALPASRSWRSSAFRRSSGHRWPSRSRNWRSSRSTPPTRPPPQHCEPGKPDG